MVQTVARLLPACSSMSTDDCGIAEIDQLARIADAAAHADLDAVERDVKLVRFESCIGGADGRQNSAPVGISAEHGTLEQIVAGHGAGHGHRLALAGRTGDGDGDLVGRTFTVCEQLLG